MKARTLKQLEKHLDRLKYYKIQRYKINRKIRYEIATIRKITNDSEFNFLTSRAFKDYENGKFKESSVEDFFKNIDKKEL